MNFSKSSGAIQLSIIYIKNDNITELKKILNLMPLDKLGDNADYLLSTFLSVCASYGRVDAAKSILKAWKLVYPNYENMQILSRLFLINPINLSTLSFVVLSHKDYTYIELMDDLMTGDNSPDIVVACEKADEIFGEQTYEIYSIVKSHAEEVGNWRVEEYAIAHMEELAPYAPVPEWVKNYYGEGLIKQSEMYVPETGDIKFELPSDEEAIKLMTHGLETFGLSLEDSTKTKEYLMDTYKQATQEEKIEKLRPIIETQYQKNLVYDEYLFRVFGPANPLVNQDLTLKGKSNKYGGCRIFLCDIFDYDEEYDYVEDWFIGVCQTCHLKIRYFWHAVRKPRPHGGFVGCYCSWKCTRDSLFEDEEEPDLLTHELINYFEEEITRIGIQDRLED